MGCDIHLFTEKKRTINNQEKWVNVDNWKINHWKIEPEESEFEVNSAYCDRNYDLFAILSDVRNYDHVKPISEPKGLPPDVSEIVKKQSDE